MSSRSALKPSGRAHHWRRRRDDYGDADGNSNFPAGSIVTITGLTGTQTADTTLTVTSTDGVHIGHCWDLGCLDESGWDTGADSSTARAHAYNAPCTVTFVLKQAAAEYTPPARECCGIDQGWQQHSPRLHCAGGDGCPRRRTGIGASRHRDRYRCESSRGGAARV